MRTRHDPTNLDHVAFIGVGIRIVGWILELLLPDAAVCMALA